MTSRKSRLSYKFGGTKKSHAKAKTQKSAASVETAASFDPFSTPLESKPPSRTGSRASSQASSRGESESTSGSEEKDPRIIASSAGEILSQLFGLRPREGAMNMGMCDHEPFQYPDQFRNHVTDPSGQSGLPGMKPRMTTMLWEDEGTLCFQVEARGICVARREGNFRAVFLVLTFQITT